MVDSPQLGLDETLAFLHRWYRHVPPPHEAPDVALPVGLPDALGRLYRAFGGLLARRRLGRPCPFSGQDHLYGPSELDVHGGQVTFAVENQANWTCRCALGVENPPVLCDARTIWDPDARGFEVVNDALDNFLITLCLQEAVMSSLTLLSVDDDWKRPVELRPLWLGGIYVNGESEHAFYYDEGRDAIAMEYGGWWLGSNRTHADDLLRSTTNAQVIHAES